MLVSALGFKDHKNANVIVRTGEIQRIEIALEIAPIESNVEIGDIDVGYGPAKAIHAAAISRFYDALLKVDAATLRAGYKPDAMLQEDIYLGHFFAENPEEGIDYIQFWFAELRNFIERCVARNQGVVSYIS